MTAEIKVTSLTHEEIVDILSTAFYGCDFLDADYDSAFWRKIPAKKKEGSCWEDHMADVLLNDGIVTVVDKEADGELYTKAGIPCRTEKAPWWDTDHPYEFGVYDLTLSALLKACSTPYGFALLNDVIQNQGDYYTANNLIQLAIFGEVIYG